MTLQPWGPNLPAPRIAPLMLAPGDKTVPLITVMYHVEVRLHPRWVSSPGRDLSVLFTLVSPVPKPDPALAFRVSTQDSTTPLVSKSKFSLSRPTKEPQVAYKGPRIRVYTNTTHCISRVCGCVPGSPFPSVLLC